MLVKLNKLLFTHQTTHVHLSFTPNLLHFKFKMTFCIKIMNNFVNSFKVVLLPLFAEMT